MILSVEVCYVCGELANFTIEDNTTLLREATCSHCHASIRNSDTAKILMLAATGTDIPLLRGVDLLASKKVSILEAQASGAIHRALKDYPYYNCFEFIDNTEPGVIVNGIMSNDLQQLSFDDESFDIIISQDVFEHIEQPELALAELNRVLRPEGYHIFTVPLHETSPTKSRANLRPIFHGDALRMGGALVYTDWGTDLPEITSRFGMETKQWNLHVFYQPAEITNVDISYSDYLTTDPLYYYRYNSIVFESRKKARVHSETRSASKLQLLQFGPDSIVAGIPFNVQSSGDSAIWALAQNLTSTTVIKIDDVALVSHANEDDNFITAVVPAWLYTFKGTHTLYLYDSATKQKSNGLPFIVSKNKQSPDINIIQLQQDFMNLAKELHLSKTNMSERTFEGWGMATNHQLPWEDEYQWETFRTASEDIKRRFNFGLMADTGIHAGNADHLLWRHWVVAFAIQYALEFAEINPTRCNFVECGVGDGMSAFFALRELNHFEQAYPAFDYKMHLYDSWGMILGDNLPESERSMLGKYKDNSFERSQMNLAEFEPHIEYHRGYIPDTLTEPISPIAYFHIDLNSAKATVEALEFFYPSLQAGSVILFDDYGWLPHAETKSAIDRFLADKPGKLLKMPTGQAIFYYRTP